VTGIDWGHKQDRLLTCSHDRNAYVWTFEKDHWKPTLVILRINRAATCCQWSPKEDKFAVGTGAKCISVCYFENDNNWWVSKHIANKAGIDSTIVSLDWHPNNVLLAAAGTDNKARVVSGFVKGLDTKNDVADSTFGQKLPFGTLCKEWQATGWVQAIKWSPSGKRLAWASHDSTVHFLDAPTENHKLTSVKYNSLPFRDILWIDEERVVCVGHDANPTLFSGGNNPKFERQLDVKAGGNVQSAQSAKNKFQAMAKMGSAEAGQDKTLDTKHQNCISVIRAVDAKTFATTGLDGNVALWPFASVGL